MGKPVLDIITDEQIEAVHANANFGNKPKRDVVDEGVIKAMLGFSCGHTQMQILHEHGLIHAPRNNRGHAMKLSVKGRRYFHAIFDEPIVDQIMKLRDGQPKPEIWWRQVGYEGLLYPSQKDAEYDVMADADEMDELNFEKVVAYVIDNGKS